MKAKELRNKTLAELHKLLQEERKKLLNLKIEKELGKLKQTHLLKETKRKIARFLTIINEKTKQNA